MISSRSGEYEKKSVNFEIFYDKLMRKAGGFYNPLPLLYGCPGFLSRYHWKIYRMWYSFIRESNHQEVFHAVKNRRSPDAYDQDVRIYSLFQVLAINKTPYLFFSYRETRGKIPWLLCILIKILLLLH